MRLVDAHCHLERADCAEADAAARARSRRRARARDRGRPVPAPGDWGNALELAAGRTRTSSRRRWGSTRTRPPRPREADFASSSAPAPGRSRRGRRGGAGLLLRPLAARGAGARSSPPVRAGERAGQAAGRPRARRPRRCADVLRERGHVAGRDPLLHRRHGRGAALPGPRLPHLHLRDRHLQEDRGAPGRGALRAAGPAAGRDRQPVPRAGAAPREEERARARGGDGAQGGRAQGPDPEEVALAAARNAKASSALRVALP